MRWREGQRFLADNYNGWQDRYTWYMRIVDFTSQNDDGDIEVDVELQKYDENNRPTTSVVVRHESLESAVEDGELTLIDELNPEEQTNVPSENERGKAEMLSL